MNPTLAGRSTPQSIHRAPNLTWPEGAVGLGLLHLERIAEGLVWPRYEVAGHG